MASVPILSTGRDTAVYLDNSQINRSAEKLQGEIIGTEKLKLNKSLQEEQDFLKAIQVDPVALMTQAGIEQQSQKIDEFNKTWMEEMRKSKGILSTEQKIRMQQHKVGVQSFQQNLAGNQQRALEELKLYRTNPTKYNKDAFEGNFLNFLATGEYGTGLQAAPGRLNKSLDDDIKAYFLTKPSKTVEGVNSKGGKVITTVTQGSKEEGMQRILSLIASDDTGGYLQDIVDEFTTLPIEDQKKILDVDKSGTVTEDELNLSRQYGSAATLASNPIVKWAMESKSERYVSSDPKISSPPSGAGGFALNIGGKKVAYEIPAEAKERKLSNKTTSTAYYNTYVDEPINFALSPTAKAVDPENGDEMDVPVGTNIDARIVGYLRDKDMVVLQPTTGVGSLNNAQIIIVPRSEVTDKIPTGVQIKIGDKNVPIGEGKTSTPSQKKKYNPATGKFE